MDYLIGIIVRVIVWFSKYSAMFAKWGIGAYEAWEPGKKIKLLLVGYNGMRNTGADARVVAMVEQIESVFGREQIEISVMTLDKESMRGYFPERVQLISFHTIFFLELYRQCCRHHAVLLCEGSTLKSTFANALTLFFCQAAGIMKQQKKPCIAYGSEIGTMEPFLEKIAVDLCSDTYFIVRTQDSYNELQKLGLHGHVGTDTAWTFPAEALPLDVRNKLIRDGWDGIKPLLGVAVINPFWWPVRSSIQKWVKTLITGDKTLQYNKWYYFSDSEQRKTKYQRYIAQIAQAVQQYALETDCHIVLIGMEKLDESACRDLSNLLNVPHSIILSKDETAFTLTALLRNLSLLITSRYHACVLSMEAQIPVIAISMDERLDNLMREVGLAEQYLLHVEGTDLTKAIYAAIQSAEINREFIATRMALQMQYYYETVNHMAVFLQDYLYKHFEQMDSQQERK